MGRPQKFSPLRAAREATAGAVVPFTGCKVPAHIGTLGFTNDGDLRVTFLVSRGVSGAAENFQSLLANPMPLDLEVSVHDEYAARVAEDEERLRAVADG